jgi:hypothetical protein
MAREMQASLEKLRKKNQHQQANDRIGVPCIIVEKVLRYLEQVLRFMLPPTWTRMTCWRRGANFRPAAVSYAFAGEFKSSAG